MPPDGNQSPVKKPNLLSKLGPKKLKDSPRFSKSQLVVFILVFGVIGGYLVFRSFAATPVVGLVQAEKMVLPSGSSVIQDTAANGGQSVKTATNGVLRSSFALASNATSLTFIGRGTVCNGQGPRITLNIDGRNILSNQALSSTSWKNYSSNINLSSGNHTIALTISSVGRVSYYCTRTAYSDVSIFYGSLPTTPAPTISLSASPTSISAGSASTLTWSSTNATNCSASGSWSGTRSTSGSTSTGALNSNTTYGLSCTGTGGSSSTSAAVSVMPIVTKTPVKLGAYPGSTFPADIDTYTQLAGRKPDVIYWFQSWSEPLYYSSQMTGIDARGVLPQITWSPGGISLSSLNSGTYDSYIVEQAKAAKAYGKPMQIRLAHEFNGPWMTFCPCVNSQTNAQFITFWRHVVDIFRANGATNVQWVWSPNIYVANSTGGAVPFDAMYPGDSYVDWVGLDGYNFGPPNNTWQSLITVFKPSYTDLVALTNKPIMIAEWGSTEDAGDKAAWIRQGFLTDLPAQMPRVLQVDSFDKVAESDFRINSSASALAAYQEVVKSALYGGP